MKKNKTEGNIEMACWKPSITDFFYTSSYLRHRTINLSNDKLEYWYNKDSESRQSNKITKVSSKDWIQDHAVPHLFPNLGCGSLEEVQTQFNLGEA